MNAPVSPPLLPPGDLLFAALPAAAVVLEQLAPVVGSGAIVVSQEERTAVLLVRDGVIMQSCLLDRSERLTGDAALAAARTLPGGTVTALRLGPELVDALAPFLVRGETCYRDLRLAWTDWDQLLADLAARGEAHLVEIRSPAGRGVTIMNGGEHVATYTDTRPALGDLTLLDGLGHQPSGTVTVVRVGPPALGAGEEPAAPQHRSSPLAPAVGELLPDLKLVARNRLHRSSSRVESLLDDAAAGGRPLDDVLADIRALAIRGVMPATLSEMSDGMRAIAQRGSRAPA